MSADFRLYTERPIFRAAQNLIDMTAEIAAIRGDGAVRFVMTGGAAMAVYSLTRSSSDIEGIFSHRMLLPDILIPYVDESGKKQTLSWDRNYSPTLGLLHPEYETNLVFVAESSDRKIRVMILDPLDLAVTKIARYADNDRADIQELFEIGHLRPDQMEQRTLEALDYYIGDMRQITENLDSALSLMGYMRTLPNPDQTSSSIAMAQKFTDAERLRHGSDVPLVELSAAPLRCRILSVSDDATVAYIVHDGVFRAAYRMDNAPMPKISAYKGQNVILTETPDGTLSIKETARDDSDLILSENSVTLPTFGNDDTQC